MQKQKGISTLTGIIIIAVVAFVLFGGVFTFKYFFTPTETPQTPITESQTNSNVQTVSTSTSQQLSDTLIISEINTLEGGKLEKDAKSGLYKVISPEGGYVSFTINSITKGDLNGDGREDAFVWGTTCGASCGSVFIVVVDENESSANTFYVQAIGFNGGGAAQFGVKNISINKGIISINASIPNPNDMTTIQSILNYKLVGKTLQAANQVAGLKTYKNNQLGFQIDYPTNWNIVSGPIREDGEFAFCGQEAIAGSIDGKCRPIFSVNVPDNSRGISLYLLDANKVKSKYGIHVEVPGVWWDEANNRLYELSYSDYTANIPPRTDDNVRADAFNKMLSTFKFTNTAITLTVWPDKNSFDLNNKTFTVKDQNTQKNIKIVANNDTKIYRQVSSNEYYDFQWLYTTLKNWVGPSWHFTIKGMTRADGSVLASEIYYTVQ